MRIDLRAAERRDAAELALIVDLSSHSFATWLWHGALEGDEAETAMEFGRNWLGEVGQLGGFRDAMMAQSEGEIVGASIGYGLDAAILSVVPAQEALVPLVQLQAPLAGHWFIDTVGVYKRHRRRGIGRKLVEHEIGRAGGRPVSLITEHYNASARALYRSLGFVEADRRQAVPLYADSMAHEWVLMTRKAA